MCPPPLPLHSKSHDLLLNYLIYMPFCYSQYHTLGIPQFAKPRQPAMTPQPTIFSPACSNPQDLGISWAQGKMCRFTPTCKYKYTRYVERHSGLLATKIRADNHKGLTSWNLKDKKIGNWCQRCEEMGRRGLLWECELITTVVESGLVMAINILKNVHDLSQ